MALNRANGTNAAAEISAAAEREAANRTIALQMHEKLHQMHHHKALAGNSCHSNLETFSDIGNTPAKTQTKLVKSKRRSKNSANQSRHTDEFEFTRALVTKSTATTTEQSTLQWTDGVSSLELEMNPLVRASEIGFGVAEDSNGSMFAGYSQEAEYEIPFEFDQHEKIQACCGNAFQCQNFTRAEDLFGVACCGQQPYNVFTKICCSGAVRDRKTTDGRYAELCCGTETLAYDQTCCSGVVHNVAGGDCCGQAVYSKSDTALRCCNETLVRTTSANDICCGSSTFDGGRTQICCGDSVPNLDAGVSFQVFQMSDVDSCCESPGGTFQAFNSASQFCCGTPQQRNGNTACCYLRQNGELLATAYNKMTQCCKYPFDIIQQMTNGSCV